LPNYVIYAGDIGGIQLAESRFGLIVKLVSDSVKSEFVVDRSRWMKQIRDD